MKHNNISKSALTYMIIGLLIVVLTSITGRYLLLSDFMKDFLRGLGLGLEFIALLKIRQSNKKTKSAKS